MNASKFIPVAVLAGLLLSHPSFGASDEKLVWGENVGFVLAHVDRTDSDKGLTIHATPSVESPVLGYLPKGTRVLSYNQFKDGWVKLQGPKEAAWVKLNALKPIPFEGTVTKVDQQDFRLPIKAAPGAAREKVGCAQIGEVLKFTGVMTSDNWIQLADRRGWVSAASVEVSLSPSQSAPAGPKTASAVPTEKAQQPSPTKGSVPTSQGPKSATADAQKGLVVMCNAGWCVDYAKAQVTHDGKAVPNTDCFKNTVCAGIVGQHHVAKAVLDGSITFGKFKLLANGAISTIKGDQVANCAESGGISHKCVASFLSQMIAGTTGGKEDPSKTKKPEASKEQAKKAPAQKVEPKKQSSAKAPSRSTREAPLIESLPSAGSDRSDDLERLHQQNLEEAWGEARRLGF